MASRTHRTRQTSTSEEALEIIRRLCSERAMLVEEVKQLSAAVMVYKELARRAENVRG